MKKKNVLICLDRDGTMIYDDGNYHLGRQRNWRSLIKFLPGVISGIKKLRKIPNVKIYMITNQPGVAVKDFSLLTEDRAHDVCVEVLKQLKKAGAGLDGYGMCPHVSPRHTRKHVGRRFKPKLVCNCRCVKPNVGMIREALKQEGWKLNETEVYFLGDRATDVQAGLNAHGWGVLVPFRVISHDTENVRKMTSKQIYVAKNFLDAVRFVLRKV